MRHQSFIIGCALAAFANRIRGRAVAVNEAPDTPSVAAKSATAAAIPVAPPEPKATEAPAPATPAAALPPRQPAVAVGVPANLDRDKVLARQKALIAAGTDPVLAEKLAIDVEQQQFLRDTNQTVAGVEESRGPANAT
jgi:hypothetical protein